MRFMLIVQATSYSEAGIKPGRSYSEAVEAYRKSLAEAGVLLAAEELRPSSTGIRIRYSPDGEQPVFEAGPFAAGQGLPAGYTLIEVNSAEEAAVWARQMPVPFGTGAFAIEVRELTMRSGRAKEPMERALEADLKDQLDMLKYT
ncbi:YciI family protein [Paenibacillus sp. 1P03SA]|uniref:YciI family protein n=1 Tax=Paenibacillus sp. 1P03SA TaxID=3132294 RepID=UPI0039A0158C